MHKMPTLRSFSVLLPSQITKIIQFKNSHYANQSQRIIYIIFDRITFL
jgi:hypothetical protein